MVKWVSLQIHIEKDARSTLVLQGRLFMSTKRSPLTRSTYGLCGFLALLFLLVACSGGQGNSGSSSTPSAQQLIKNAQAAIQKVTSYHFELKAENIGTTGVLPIQSATGDIIVPDKLQANANVLFNGTPIQAEIIAIDKNEYINVLGSWQKTSGLLDPQALSDPQTGVAASLGHLQNPGTPSSSSSGGVPCWSITGQLNASYLAGITGGGAPAGTTDTVTTCIGKSDNLPYIINVKGIAAQGDTTQTTRTFTLSKFNEQITITAPIQ
jgi:hypothetical protein